MPARSEPCLFIVFGATGDLMTRKLLPALYHLGRHGQLSDDFRILGVGRSSEMDHEALRRTMCEALVEAGLGRHRPEEWCERTIYYHSIHDNTPEDFARLRCAIETLEREHQLTSRRVFYLALPPQAFPGTIIGLGEAGLNISSGWTRLVIEKPFGRDLASARELNDIVHRYFDESQIYRIDHYLGKETVQNLMVFRFANPIFESLWNRSQVESVQITVAESLGIDSRAGYYEHAGAMRDMIQNHLSQLLCLIAMEVPDAFDAEAIRDEKNKVMRVIAPVQPDDIVFGQYQWGTIEGEEVVGYRDEAGVAASSRTETFVAMKLEVPNWRWQGVPFYLRTGKRMPRRSSRIMVTFRCAPVALFKPYACPVNANVLGITLQPEEGFDLQFEVKHPGQPLTVASQRLRFRYAEAFSPLPDAYETLLLDILAGDATLFVRGDWVERSWKLYTPVLENPPAVEPYAAGTWGPPASKKLLARDNRVWLPV
jgi:glucose-6-phosphate 1-dehydrogenase